MSGGQSDSSVLAVAHREGDTVVLDLVEEVRAPHKPAAAVAHFAPMVKAYGGYKVIGDRYASGFSEGVFSENRLKLEHSELNKSELFAEFLPILNSGRVRLLDDKRLVTQLCALERRTNPSGKDTIAKPAGGHDDIANAAAGACVLAAGKRRPIGELITPEHLAAISVPPRVFFGTGDQP
jgi:hypothetical protein